LTEWCLIIKQRLDAKYEKADLNALVRAMLSFLNKEEQEKLLILLLKKHKH
jgi:hypothetical protein